MNKLLIRQGLINYLEMVARGDFPKQYNFNLGICYNVSKYMLGYYQKVKDEFFGDWADLLDEEIIEFEFFSGIMPYPVSHPEVRNGCEAYRLESFYGMYTGEYGRRRMAYAQYWADCLKERLHD